MPKLTREFDVHRHLAPAIDGMAVGEDLAFDDDAGAFLCAEIRARQEDHAHPQHAGTHGEGNGCYGPACGKSKKLWIC